MNESHDHDKNWQKAGKCAGLTQARIHDLKHVFGRRLRAAGIPLDPGKVLLGHPTGDITTHCSAPELEELIKAANRLYKDKPGTADINTKECGAAGCISLF